MAGARKTKGGKGSGAANDRRRDRRSSVQIPVFYHVEDGVEERVSATLDLSLSGLQFPCRRKLREKDRLRMRLLVPGQLRPLVLHGVVRWIADDEPARGEVAAGRPGAERYHVGVRFERRESEQRKVLKDFLARGA